MAGISGRWSLAALTALLVLAVAGCGSGGSSTAASSAARTTASATPNAESAKAKEREFEKKECEFNEAYDETHPAARRIDERSKVRWETVYPLLHQYEANPSPALVKRITTIEPTLAHYNDITGAANLDPRRVKEFLGEEKELLDGRSC